MVLGEEVEVGVTCVTCVTCVTPSLQIRNGPAPAWGARPFGVGRALLVVRVRLLVCRT